MCVGLALPTYADLRLYCRHLFQYSLSGLQSTPSLSMLAKTAGKHKRAHICWAWTDVTEMAYSDWLSEGTISPLIHPVHGRVCEIKSRGRFV